MWFRAPGRHHAGGNGRNESPGQGRKGSDDIQGEPGAPSPPPRSHAPLPPFKNGFPRFWSNSWSFGFCPMAPTLMILRKMGLRQTLRGPPRAAGGFLHGALKQSSQKISCGPVKWLLRVSTGLCDPHATGDRVRRPSTRSPPLQVPTGPWPSLFNGVGEGTNNLGRGLASLSPCCYFIFKTSQHRGAVFVGQVKEKAETRKQARSHLQGGGKHACL